MTMATKTSKQKEQPEEPTEAERVAQWRRGEFVRMLEVTPDNLMVSLDDVERLVHSEDADLHKAEGMLENGCPPNLVVEILS